MNPTVVCPRSPLRFCSICYFRRVGLVLRLAQLLLTPSCRFFGLLIALFVDALLSAALYG